jgi:hypothetical protein
VANPGYCYFGAGWFVLGLATGWVWRPGSMFEIRDSISGAQVRVVRVVDVRIGFDKFWMLWHPVLARVF